MASLWDRTDSLGWLPVKGPNGFGVLRKIDNINTNDNINRDLIKQLPKLSYLNL